MSAWPGKFLIGLTGNIATGKSAVRKLLEHLGACGIDADALSKETVAWGTPGYRMVLDTFGSWLLDSEGQIDREKLGRLVFSDPVKLEELEQIIHPFVVEMVDTLVRRSSQGIIVLEAIKLLESGLADSCDTVWVVSTSPELQQKRLTEHRGMDSAQAIQRIDAQSPAAEKITRADLVIQNSSSLVNLWNQVLAASRNLLPETQTFGAQVRFRKTMGEQTGISWAGPDDGVSIAELLARVTKTGASNVPGLVEAAFTEKAFLLYYCAGQIQGLACWRTANSSAIVEDLIFLEDSTHMGAIILLLREIEQISTILGCKILLVELPEQYGPYRIELHMQGYQDICLEDLNAPVWREQIKASKLSGSSWMTKRLPITNKSGPDRPQ